MSTIVTGSTDSTDAISVTAGSITIVGKEGITKKLPGVSRASFIS